MKNFIGSVSYEEFLRGLLLISDDNTLGGVWEKSVSCDRCAFEKQCHAICNTIENMDPAKNPTCRDVVNLLLGDIKAEDIK